MTKKEQNEEFQNQETINILNNNNGLKCKYKNYFHLTKKSIFSEHNNYICTNIIQNILSHNLYFSLKNNITGEGYIFEKENNIYLKAHSQTISKLLIDYNKNFLISCSYDKYIKIWDISKINTKNTCISLLKGHKGRIYDMDLVKDKNKLLSCGMDKNILIWDMENFVLFKNIMLSSSFHNLVIKYLLPIENKNNLNELILIYSKNGIINFINLNEEKIIDKINIGIKEGPILFVNNKECLYQNNKKLCIIIYNFVNKSIVGELNGCNKNIILLYKFERLNKVISFDNGNNIKIWNYTKQFCELCINIDFVLNCIYVNNNGELFCGSSNKTLTL